MAQHPADQGERAVHDEDVIVAGSCGCGLPMVINERNIPSWHKRVITNHRICFSELECLGSSSRSARCRLSACCVSWIGSGRGSAISLRLIHRRSRHPVPSRIPACRYAGSRIVHPRCCHHAEIKWQPDHRGHASGIGFPLSCSLGRRSDQRHENKLRHRRQFAAERDPDHHPEDGGQSLTGRWQSIIRCRDLSRREVAFFKSSER